MNSHDLQVATLAEVEAHFIEGQKRGYIFAADIFKEIDQLRAEVEAQVDYIHKLQSQNSSLLQKAKRAEKAEAEVERLKRDLSNPEGAEFMYEFARLELIKEQADNQRLREALQLINERCDLAKERNVTADACFCISERALKESAT